MLGKLLGSATRIINTPATVIDEIFDCDTQKNDRVVSQPLELLAEALDDADKGWEDKR